MRSITSSLPLRPRRVWVPLHDINFSQGQPVRKIAHLNDYAQQGWEGNVLAQAK
ncbi:Uncharacterised protein [Serratia fonticola]|uniref:Uncharacterized protein n=1 Tax=Serratia fonticola TaxID=47917 RepID=A0A4U9TGK7_SERFO|nr:Uncharacterised protein [Serratia fonticola]